MGLLATYLDSEALLLQVNEYKLLKKDVFGQISLIDEMDSPVILRDASCASAWARPFARWLVSREARALARIASGMVDLPIFHRYCLV